MNTPFESAAPAIPQPDATKLAALLGLAAGAVALPQAGQADIIYTDLSSNPGIVNYNSPDFLFSVPGTSQVGFFGVQRVATTTLAYQTTNFRSVLAGMVTATGAPAGVGGNPSGFVEHLPLGATWDQPLAVLYSAVVAYANDLLVTTPNSGYSNRYLAWVFRDSTQGNVLRYGWAEYNLSVAGYNAGGPTVSILRYAYDNAGAKPTMGQLPVPEPTSGALFALGAMALGARGLRQWRQNRQPVKQA
jgi:hypothetical protein